MNANYILILTHFIILHDKLYSIQNDFKNNKLIIIDFLYSVLEEQRSSDYIFLLVFQNDNKISYNDNTASARTE